MNQYAYNKKYLDFNIKMLYFRQSRGYVETLFSQRTQRQQPFKVETIQFWDDKFMNGVVNLVQSRHNNPTFRKFQFTTLFCQAFLSETHAMGHNPGFELVFLEMMCRTIDILPNENHQRCNVMKFIL